MKSRLSIENIKKAFDNIDPVFLNTPQFICDSLSEILNCKVILKVETLNPIRCFKGRSAFNYVSNLKEGSTLVCASAGNLGQAVAYACSKKNIKPIIFASKNANPLKIERMKSLGAEVVLKGEDFDDARIFAKKYALKNNFDLIEDSLDINTCEGAGTIGMELLKLDTHLDAVLVALGNGGLLTGVARCIKEYSPNTEVIGVVAKGAPAMAKSFEKNCLINSESIDTIADGIAIRNPIPEILDEMKITVDKVIQVGEKEIIDSMKLLHTNASIVFEPSSSVCIAAILDNKDYFKGKTVAVVICGANITEEQIKEYLF